MSNHGWWGGVKPPGDVCQLISYVVLVKVCAMSESGFLNQLISGWMGIVLNRLIFGKIIIFMLLICLISEMGR